MPQHLFIPDDWKQWIALNLMLGQPQDGLLRILIDKGFPEQLSRLELQTAAVHPYLAAAQSLVRQRSKRDWLLHTWRMLESTSPRACVERKSTVDPGEFVSEYYSQNRPVIICDVLRRWPAIAKWNREYLIRTVGRQEVEIQANRNSDPRYELNSSNHRQKIAFAEFVDMVYRQSATNDFYMTANNADVNRTALAPLWPDIDYLPEYLAAAQRDGRAFFWMGPAGTITPLHHDLTNNFMAQVVGRKKIKLISPSHLPMIYNDYHCYSAVDLDNVDLVRYPEFRHVRIEEIVLEPGELLFLPVGWWHHVTGLDASVTLTFTNFRQNNQFTNHYTTYSTI